MRGAALLAALLLATVPAAAAPTLAQCKGADGYLASGQRTFLWRPEWLAAQRTAAAKDAALRQRLIRGADAALRRGP